MITLSASGYSIRWMAGFLVSWLLTPTIGRIFFEECGFWLDWEGDRWMANVFASWTNVRFDIGSGKVKYREKFPKR